MTPDALNQLKDAVLLYISSELGVTIPRILAAIFGLLIMMFTIMSRWEKRLKIAPALLCLLAGGFLVAISVKSAILHSLVALSYPDRIRFLLALISIVVMAITFESIRISRLRERYALLWMATAGLIFLASLFPDIVRFLTVLLGVQYVTAVSVVLFTFLLLVVFHFSIALSGLEEDRSRIAQRCALLEMRIEEIESRLGVERREPQLKTPRRESSSADVAPSSAMRSLKGAEAGARLVIGLAIFAVLFTGLRAKEPLLGDEVTHYYMLKQQSSVLPTPSFKALIPNAWGDEIEKRGYPHPNGWHYLGALVYRLSGGSLVAVQLFHTVFWLQFLLVAFLWSRSRGGTRNRSTLLYLIVIASVPMHLLFAVSFYQDVPMAAQALTAFYLLDRRRYILASIFMALALWMKVTGILFALPFLLVGAYRLRGDVHAGASSIPRSVLLWLLMAIFPISMMCANAWMLKRYGGAEYYPAAEIMQRVRGFLPTKPRETGIRDIPTQPRKMPLAREASREEEAIANHPGDLRKPVNFVVYGGALFWIVALGAVFGLLRPRSTQIPEGASRKNSWPLWVGLFYIVIAYLQLRSAPDARFFLPAIAFVALPLSEWCMRLPQTRILLALAAVAGVLQAGSALAKVDDLRSVSPGIRETIEYLRENPPEPNRIFMYPEGHYRLFPSRHDWYLGRRLKIFWKSDMTERIQILQERKIGAIVIKHHLVATIDKEMNNLGIYPTFFVDSLASDPRFKVLFSNAAATVYGVPPPTPPPAAP